MPRRQALALIAAGRAEADKSSRLAEPLRQPDPVVITGTPEAIATKMDELTGFTGSEGTEGVPCTCPEDADHPPILLAPVDMADVEIAPAGELQYVSDTPDADVPTVDAVPLPPEPKPTALRSVWAEYATSLGVEVTSTMTRRQIKDAAEEAAQSLSNLPQPALTGGRLETPEDEPAAESAADEGSTPQ
jgi:hypothetical protein